MNKNRIKKKLSSQSGESISEALVAVLITSLAVLLFVTMVSASTRIIQSSETKMSRYYQEISAQPASETEAVIRFSDGDSGKPLFVNGTAEQKVTLYKNTEGTALYYTGDEP